MYNLAVETEPSHGPYPERAQSRLGWLERTSVAAIGFLSARKNARLSRWEPFVSRVAEEGRKLTNERDQELHARMACLRDALRSQGMKERFVVETFALVREVAWRRLGCRHFDTQLIGGKVLLDGMVAEMEAGEGKTLTATLPVCTAALAGIPVHVVTVNDYLARRDAEWMGPIYRELGLSVGVITHGMDQETRRAAYACDVTYCTNKELTFDYLKDRITIGRHFSRLQLQLERLYGEDTRLPKLLLRGLCFAIVDEADSVLVDEARTPLIISGGSAGTLAQREYKTALSIASQLEVGHDFLIDGDERAITLTDAGKMKLDDLARPLGGIWAGRQRRENLVHQALVAQRLLLQDKHYLVRDGKIQIIDEYTGRVAADRSWERGIHQLLETKEGCDLSHMQEPLARISYQRFFRRYLRLAGMTGTAREIASELWSVYRLKVVSIPTNRPLRRRAYSDRVYASDPAKWQAIVGRISRVHKAGRPVLIGTRSVAASEHLSGLLTAAGLPHQLLNARQDSEEAAIIAGAGEPRRITVATNMAGRGTDIRLAPEVIASGGLHVIATERHDARRIDRQLFGRCGRQGDPGTYEAIMCLDDELIKLYGWLWAWLARRLRHSGRPVSRLMGALGMRWAQLAAERSHSRMRRSLLKMDEQVDTMLAFSGRSE